MNSYGTSTFPGSGINPGHIHFVVPSRQAYMYLGGNATDSNNWSEIDLSLKGTTGWDSSANDMHNSNSGNIIIGDIEAVPTNAAFKLRSITTSYLGSALSNIQSFSGEIHFFGPDTLDTGVGTGGRALNWGAGTITIAYGIFGAVRNESTGTITNGYGILGRIRNQRTGTITNGYGLFSDFDINNGTITNAYGLYINQILGTNKWGVYVNDASNNYFAGKVGIGTDTATSNLQVVGLPAYANNAAAAGAGLTVGAFYRTGGDPDLVCVVH